MHDKQLARFVFEAVAIIDCPRELGLGQAATLGHISRVKIFHQYRIAFESTVHGWRETGRQDLTPYPTEYWPGDPATPQNKDTQLKGRVPVMRTCIYVGGLVPTMRYRLYWNVGQITHHATFQALKRYHWLFTTDGHDLNIYENDTTEGPNGELPFGSPDAPGWLVNGEKIVNPADGQRTWEHPEATDHITLGDANGTCFEPATYYGPHGSYTDAIPGSISVK